MASSSELQHFGSDRYAVERQLGAGSMGIVYQVYDRERARTVALKTLHRGDASALYRLKREFRGLADIHHPNLVTLFELVASENDWFFTMELVDGMSFIAWVRGEEAREPIETAYIETEPERLDPRRDRLRVAPEPLEDTVEREPAWPDRPSRPASYERLRDALRQLAEGVHVLHEAGKLHRDIKPSNVMVDRSGRVVLLDFGLITDVGRPSGGVSEADCVVGTAEYMSPEQGAARPVGPASDWYAVGTMLYQALTGKLPFYGSPLSVLVDKQSRVPESPRHLVPETPEDLSRLCCELLRVDARARPRGDEILARLGKEIAHPAAPPKVRDSRALDAPLVGRGSHVAALRHAFDAVIRNERAMTVLFHGLSGMGKTILIERVARSFAQERGAVVLTGRCHERELVPYKGLDGVIDSLSRYIAELPRPDADALMPRDILAVARLFPVLLRVRAVTEAPRRITIDDPHELRRRAFNGLRDLLARVADRRPLMLAIDDFQWGDLDSTTLLLDLLRPPEPPVFLLLVAYRSEEAGKSEAVRHLVKGLRAPGYDAETVRELEVGALGTSEASELARTLLGREDEEGARLADSLARESGGDPFLVDQLVRFVHEGGTSADEITFTDVMRRQLRELAPEERRVLELIAVAGQPVREQVVAAAAGLTALDSVLTLLRARSLIKSSGAREPGRVEPYHDRIREAVLSALSEAEQRACHLALADTIEAGDVRDCEALALHLLGAGALERGIEYAIEAAQKAAAALAFERSIFFYRLAIEALPAEDVSRRRLRAALGEALVNAGRGVEGAAEYIAAAEAERSPEAARSPQAERSIEALEFRRLAAEQLLRSGHADEGIRALEAVLQGIGMKVARTPRRALWSLFRRRLRVRMRGLRFVERDVSQIGPELLRKVDVCWTAASGMATLDPIRGLDFQSRHLLLALAAGDPYRVARALAIEGTYAAITGGASSQWIEKVIALAGEMADRLGEPHARGLVAYARGLVDYQKGQWEPARRSFEQAAGIMREFCTGLADQIALSLRFELTTLFQLGSLRELCRRARLYLAEQEQRGARFAIGMRTGLSNASWLVVDDPAAAERECERARGGPSSPLDFSVEHYYELVARTHIDLYRGDGPGAHGRTSALWPRLERSSFLRIQRVRADALFLRGRAALAAASARPTRAERSALLAEVRRARRRLERERSLITDAQASALAAGEARLRGEVDAAVRLLAESESKFEAAQMLQYAAAMRTRRGELVGGAEGERLRVAGESDMRNEGVRNPPAWTRLFAPF